MPLRANDNMVMDADAQPLAGLDNLAGDLDILLAGGRVARWVVVDQDQRRRSQFHGPLDNLARIYGRLVDRSVAHILVADQHVAAVEMKTCCAEMLRR